MIDELVEGCSLELAVYLGAAVFERTQLLGQLSEWLRGATVLRNANAFRYEVVGRNKRSAVPAIEWRQDAA